MDLQRYDFTTNENFLDYEFYSEGPNGKIKKVVKFSIQNAEGTTYFNLAFGNWDEENKKLDDKAISNNNDRDIILATVAMTVLDFFDQYTDALVYIKGSTPARTRLYQIGIAANLIEIEKTLKIYGYTKTNKWQPFCKKVNFEAFFVLRK
jgi:hypothetical protein